MDEPGDRSSGAADRPGVLSGPGWWRVQCASSPPRGSKARPSPRCSKPPTRRVDPSITISRAGSPNCCMPRWIWPANEDWRRWRPPADNRQRSSSSAFSPCGEACWTTPSSPLDAPLSPSPSAADDDDLLDHAGTIFRTWTELLTELCTAGGMDTIGTTAGRDRHRSHGGCRCALPGRTQHGAIRGRRARSFCPSLRASRSIENSFGEVTYGLSRGDWVRPAGAEMSPHTLIRTPPKSLHRQQCGKSRPVAWELAPTRLGESARPRGIWHHPTRSAATDRAARNVSTASTSRGRAYR